MSKETIKKLVTGAQVLGVAALGAVGLCRKKKLKEVEKANQSLESQNLILRTFRAADAEEYEAKCKECEKLKKQIKTLKSKKEESK